MTEEKDSIRIDSGIYNKDSHIGIQAGRDLHLHGDNPTIQNYQHIADLIRQAEANLDNANTIPQKDARKLREDLASARNAVADKEPDSTRAIDRLKSAVRILENLVKVTASVQSMRSLIEKAITALS